MVIFDYKHAMQKGAKQTGESWDDVFNRLHEDVQEIEDCPISNEGYFCAACFNIMHSCGEMAGECDDGFCIYGINPCHTHEMPLEEALEWNENRIFPPGIVTEVQFGENSNRIGCVMGCEYEV